MMTKKRDPRRPTLPVPRGTSTIGAAAFHCQVRDGAGGAHRALATGLNFPYSVTNLILDISRFNQRGGCATTLFGSLLLRAALNRRPKPSYPKNKTQTLDHEHDLAAPVARRPPVAS